MHISNLLIFVCRWSCSISISSEKLEFYKYKMYLNVEIVTPFILLPNSKFNNFSEYWVRCHFLIPSWFHNYNFIYIWWLVDISPLSQMKRFRQEIKRKKRKSNLIFHFQTTKFSQIYRIHNCCDLQKFYY